METANLKHTGNQTQANKAADSGVFFKPVIQPKLTVNEPGDRYEQEADAVAEKVMRMTGPAINDNLFFPPAATTLHRKCKACEEEEKHVHRKEGDSDEAHGGHELDSYVSSLSSGGQAMSEGSRLFFEPRFGHDFSGVKIHTNSEAARSAQSINALAYTTGNNIVFNTGQYSPESASGKKLMAHELTHVVQQGSGSTIKKLPLPVIAGGAAAVLGGAYAYWAYHCLQPCEPAMYNATFGNAQRTGGFRLWYYNQTHAPVPSNVWDAYGHCFAGCCSKKRCGGVTAYIAGRSREFYREYLDSDPHDSYTQDVNNQEKGRDLANDPNVDCTVACQNEALAGHLDFSAPQAGFWSPATP
ncbi:MAG: DUF4157 domain-containing protein [Bacteroidota bacterium]|nr:DUF4157 domain-containing protein [Bacteroidota bacterium]